ncbi:MAG: hypothetical protein MJA30_35255, partial [Cytophagales bacterium]|nr:hypothetical protein [Cytophagales bacterium]
RKVIIAARLAWPMRRLRSYSLIVRNHFTHVLREGDRFTQSQPPPTGFAMTINIKKYIMGMIKRRTIKQLLSHGRTSYAVFTFYD